MTEETAYIPFPTPALLEISTTEWAVLIYLSETCKAEPDGTTDVSLQTIAGDMLISLQSAWECMCRLHELKYVAVTEIDGPQYVDHEVVAAVAEQASKLAKLPIHVTVMV